MDGVQLPQGLKARQSHYEETVALSEGSKAEMTLKPSSGFELVYQPGYYDV